MRRLTLRVAVALVTLSAGISAAGVWDWLRRTPAPETSIPLCRQEQSPAAYAPTLSAEQERAKQEILEILRQYDIAQTRHDAAFFERVEADSFILTMQDGSTYTRAEAIASMKTWDKTIKYASDDFDIKFYGEVATAAGRMTATEPSGNQYSWRWVDLFAKRNGRWQILSTTQLN